MEFINKIIITDCLEGIKQIPDSCIDCCISSPPYLGLRDYKIDGQIGHEENYNEYIEKLIKLYKRKNNYNLIFRSVGKLFKITMPEFKAPHLALCKYSVMCWFGALTNGINKALFMTLKRQSSKDLCGKLAPNVRWLCGRAGNWNTNFSPNTK